MATIHLQDVPEDLYDRLQKLAQSHHRTIVAQAIALLESALPHETRKSVPEIIEDIRRRREQLPTDVEWSDSTATIREDRDR